jgi:hypothetical protein
MVVDLLLGYLGSCDFRPARSRILEPGNGSYVVNISFG